jgi:hypothetical protein
MKQIVQIWLLILALFLSSCAPGQTSTPSPAPKNTSTSILQGLPVFPNATESKNDVISYHYTVENANIEDVQRFYKDQMQTAGWKLLGAGDVSGPDIGKAYVLWFTKDQDIASVDIFTRGDVIHVTIILE